MSDILRNPDGSPRVFVKYRDEEGLLCVVELDRASYMRSKNSPFEFFVLPTPAPGESMVLK